MVLLRTSLLDHCRLNTFAKTSPLRSPSFSTRIPPPLPFCSVSHEAAVGDDAHPKRALRVLEAAVPEHVRLSPGVVEPHVERQHDPHGAVQLHARQRGNAGQRHKLHGSGNPPPPPCSPCLPHRGKVDVMCPGVVGIRGARVQKHSEAKFKEMSPSLLPTGCAWCHSLCEAQNK